MTRTKITKKKLKQLSDESEKKQKKKLEGKKNKQRKSETVSKTKLSSSRNQTSILNYTRTNVEDGRSRIEQNENERSRTKQKNARSRTEQNNEKKSRNKSSERSKLVEKLTSSLSNNARSSEDSEDVDEDRISSDGEKYSSTDEKRTQKSRKSKDKQGTTVVKRKRKIKSVDNDSPEASSLKKKKFFDRQIQTWKPLSNETKLFTKQVLDHGIGAILNRNLNLDYAEIQTKLDSIKSRLLVKINRLTGPVNKYGDYRKLLSCKRQLQVERSKYEDQEDILEEAVDVAERDQTLLEEENKKIERLLDHIEEVHPLLRKKYIPQLDLPDIF